MEIKQRDIILVQYPFSDFSTAKVRPAVVLSNNAYNKTSKDVTVVPLTSNLTSINYSLLLTNDELSSGKLIVDSRARIDRIFSVDKQIIKMKVAKINNETFDKVIDLLSDLVKKESKSSKKS